MLFEAQLSVMLFFNCYYYFFRPPLEFFWPMRALSLAFLRLVHVSTSINISTNQNASKSAFICRKSEFWRRKRKRRKKQAMDRKMTESVSRLYLNWFILCSTINLNNSTWMHYFLIVWLLIYHFMLVRRSILLFFMQTSRGMLVKLPLLHLLMPIL